MHASELLHDHLKKSCPLVNKATLSRLIQISQSLHSGGKLSLTSLGRALSGSAYVKHKIKAVDRFLGNERLYSNRQNIYRALAAMVIGEMNAIDVLVDWSPCGNRKQQMLRASLFHKSRSIVLYEEVHPETMKTKRTSTENKFLETLKEIIPDGVDVTVITDAGFRCDWFAQVLTLGWDFEGRVRGNTHYSLDKKVWKKAVSLYETATKKPTFIGNVFLTKANELTCQMYLYKEKSAKKKKSKKTKLSSRASKKYHKAEVTRMKNKSQDPWIIVSSKAHSSKRKKQVIASYKRRMKIEHEFRSTKNIEWGVGLDRARSNSTKRLEILLLIAAISMLALWLVGYVAEQKKLHYRYQANTIKSHRVLSLIFLGLQIVRDAVDLIKPPDLLDLMQQIQSNEVAI